MSFHRITDRKLTVLDLRTSLPGSRFVIRGCDALTELLLPAGPSGLEVELRLKNSSQEVLVSGNCSRLRGGVAGRRNSQLVLVPAPGGDAVLVTAYAPFPNELPLPRALRALTWPEFSTVMMLLTAVLMILQYFGVVRLRRFTGLCLLVAAIASPGPHGLAAIDEAWEMVTSEE